MKAHLASLPPGSFICYNKADLSCTPRDGGAFQGGTVSAVYPADALKSFTPPLLLSPASQLLLNFVLDVIFFF